MKSEPYYNLKTSPFSFVIEAELGKGRGVANILLYPDCNLAGLPGVRQKQLWSSDPARWARLGLGLVTFPLFPISEGGVVVTAISDGCWKGNYNQKQRRLQW